MTVVERRRPDMVEHFDEEAELFQPLRAAFNIPAGTELTVELLQKLRTDGQRRHSEKSGLPIATQSEVAALAARL